MHRRSIQLNFLLQNFRSRQLQKPLKSFYLAFSYGGLGFSYYIGDEFGDYYDVSYGFGDFSVSFGDYEDTGSNFLLGYGFSLGDYDASVGYSSFSAEAASGLEDEDGLFFTVGASF